MPLRVDFPNLNSKFAVKHLADDLRQGGLADPDVYQIAVDQKRILVTYNSKHFRKLAGSKNDAGIIGVSASLPASQVDTKLTALLMKRTPHALEKNSPRLPAKQKHNAALEDRQLPTLFLLLPFVMQSQHCLV
jgi:hypothetical protein